MGVPIAAGRSRVLLRQRFPDDPVLQAVLQMPGVSSLLTSLVQNVNYRTSFEEYAQLLDVAARRTDSDEAVDALVSRFNEWKRRATTKEPLYFTRWDGSTAKPSYGPQTADDDVAGTYGLKRNYVQDTPTATYAPASDDLPKA